MIVKVGKYLFIGVKEDLDEFFQRVQEAGFLQFLSTSESKNIDFGIETHTTHAAMKILRRLPVLKQQGGKLDLEKALSIAKSVVELKKQITHLDEERKFLEMEISRLAVFGDFSMEDIRFLQEEGGRRIQFFCAKAGVYTGGVSKFRLWQKGLQTNLEENSLQDFLDEQALPPGLFFIGTDYDLDYFLSIQPQAVSFPSMIEVPFTSSVKDLRLRLDEVKKEREKKDHALKEEAKYLDYLQAALIEHLNEYNLLNAKGKVEEPLKNEQEKGGVFSALAWMPIEKEEPILKLTDRLAVHFERIAIEEEDRIPTCMENSGMAKIGEDLVQVYDTPAHDDKDPSLWVFFSFVLFFSMIVADGGYGLLYFALACYLRYKFPDWTGAKKRFVQLLGVLAASCILWGILTSSFFGIPIDPRSPLGRISIVERLAVRRAAYHMETQDKTYQFWVSRYPSLKEVQDPEVFVTEKPQETHKNSAEYEILSDFSDGVLMEFALLFGVIHIALSLLRYFLRNWASLGWVLFLIGGYLYFPSVLQATSLVEYALRVPTHVSQIVGLQLIWVGIGSALFLALIQKKGAGLGEIANLIQVFSDVLSYLRLYALALAGTIMASSFNEMGGMVGFFLGALVILFGHSINILLGAMGGVIHGLRLNFIEWYHYSFEGGGTLFRPLKKLHVHQED